MEASPSEPDFSCLWSPCSCLLVIKVKTKHCSGREELSNGSSVIHTPWSVTFTRPKQSERPRPLPSLPWDNLDVWYMCVPAQGAGEPPSCLRSSFLLLAGNSSEMLKRWAILILAWFKHSTSCCRAYCKIDLLERWWSLHTVFRLVWCICARKQTPRRSYHSSAFSPRLFL